MKFEPIIAADGASGAPRDGRPARLVHASIRSDRLPETTVLIRNISRHGIGAKARLDRLQVGDTVFIRLGPLDEVAGTLRWVRGDRFGVHLHEELNPDSFNFSGSDWTVLNRPYERGHVYDQFRPTERAWRPGIKSHLKK